MKKFNSLLLFIFVILSCLGQDSCFVEPNPNQPGETLTLFKDVLFDTSLVTVSSHRYAKNVLDYHGDTIDLYTNLYQCPWNATLPYRPAFIYLHPGGFEGGNPENPDVDLVCKKLAARGYVVFAPQYRTGWDTGCSPAKACCEEADPHSAIRAVYRSVQDTRALIRAIKHFAGILKVNENWVIAGGNSAGGIAALHTAYLDEDEVISSVLDLGGLDDVGGYIGQDTELAGVYVSAAFITKKSLIDPWNDAPLLMQHGNCDRISPINVGYPFGCELGNPDFLVHGPLSMKGRLNNLNLLHKIVQVEEEGHLAIPHVKRDSVISDFAYEYILCPNNPQSEHIVITSDEPNCNYFTLPQTQCIIEDEDCNEDVCKNCKLYKGINLGDCDGFNLVFCSYDEYVPACDSTYSNQEDSIDICGTWYTVMEIQALIDALETTSLELEDPPYSYKKNYETIIGSSIFPNPSNGEFVLKFDAQMGGTEFFQLFTIEGKLIEEFFAIVGKGQNLIPVKLNTGLNSGLYLLKTKQGTHRIIIE